MSNDGLSFWDRYFATGKPSTGDLGDQLWTKEVTTANDKGDDDKRRTAILEQYKLCVEMADRISARRALANTWRIQAVIATQSLPTNRRILPPASATRASCGDDR